MHQAKTHLSRLLERVRAGDTIIIAKSGTPCAKLVPIEPRPRRTPGILRFKIDDSFFEPLPDEELDAWE